MNFPKPEIGREEAMQLWISERSDYAKNQVFLSNTRIVFFVMKELRLNPLDEDFQGIGFCGLVKAINGFEPERGNQFISYAVRMVRTEFYLFFRKKRIVPVFSLDEPYFLEKGENATYADMIADRREFTEEAISNAELDRLLVLLNETEKRILFLRMEEKSQEEIGKAFGMSRYKISKIIKRICEKWRELNGL